MNSLRNDEDDNNSLDQSSSGSVGSHQKTLVAIAVVALAIIAGATVLILRPPWVHPNSQSSSHQRKVDDKKDKKPTRRRLVNDRVAALEDAFFKQAWQSVDDPARDGWGSETTHQVIDKRLKELSAIVVAESSVESSDVTSLVTGEFRCESLLPRQVEVAFRCEQFRVERASPNGSLNKTKTQTGDVLLAEVVDQVRKRFAGAGDLRCSFKTFRINFDDRRLVTRQFVTLTGKLGDGILEYHATWQIAWSFDAPNVPPRMSEIEVKDFELVQSKFKHKTLFSDCTQSVLGLDECFEQQFLRGYDDWIERIQDTRYFSLLGAPAIAIGDVNDDGLDDLYICQEAGLPNRLLIQNPDGTASDQSKAWGVDWLDSSRGALIVDWNNDGRQDLAVATVGNVVVASNEDNGRFQIRNVLPTSDDTMSLAAADYDNDGDLDLYTCVYSPNDVPGSSGSRSSATVSERFVLHDARTGGSNSLFRNDGSADGQWSFADVTASIGLDENNNRYSFAASWEDFDNDGDQDLYVANDFGRNNLYRNDETEDGKRQFKDVASEAAAEDSAAGMAVSWSDYDRDGWMDIYVSNMFSTAGNRIAFQSQFKQDADELVRRRLQRFARGNTLLRNRGGESFEDRSLAANVNMGRWAWGSSFCDINNDGWDDLLVANGFLTTQDSGDL